MVTAVSRLEAQANDTVCAISMTKVYRVIPTPGSSYFWSVECGKIISPNPHADSIVVAWCNTPGTYKVKVVEQTKKGCWGDTASTLVTVTPKMHLDIFGPSQECVGSSVWLYASGAMSYEWNTGQTTSNIYAQLKDTNTTFTVTGKNLCETDTASFTIKVHPRPTADFTVNPQGPAVNDIVDLHYLGKGATDWTWYVDGQQDITGAISNPEVSFATKGNKKITLVSVNQFGCFDTMIRDIKVKYQADVFVPTSFTPNQDGTNENFKAVGYNLKSIHMQIYNRWGEMIFESFGVNDSWNGTYKGEQVSDGVYVWLIDAQATDDEHYYLNGNVTVMH